MTDLSDLHSDIYTGATICKEWLHDGTAMEVDARIWLEKMEDACRELRRLGGYSLPFASQAALSLGELAVIIVRLRLGMPSPPKK